MRVLDLLWDLVDEGVLRPGDSPSNPHFPWFHASEYGRTVLNTTEYIPHDPDGYLAKLRSDIARLDTDIIRYLEECLGCFRSRFLLAAAVTLGCAAEKAILLLVDSLDAALADPNERNSFKKATAHWMIASKYDALWKWLQKKLQQFPDPLSDDLKVLLDRVFDLIRSTRNAAGHPAGKVLARETVHANLLLFPSYCIRVYGLMDWLAKNKV